MVSRLHEWFLEVGKPVVLATYHRSIKKGWLPAVKNAQWQKIKVTCSTIKLFLNVPYTARLCARSSKYSSGARCRWQEKRWLKGFELHHLHNTWGKDHEYNYSEQWILDVDSHFALTMSTVMMNMHLMSTSSCSERDSSSTEKDYLCFQYWVVFFIYHPAAAE